ncbi:MAG: hypothetical protein CSA18_04095 [Deltaproteobacteria bacterium]|nr:MAG: hypothetical protein CSA18_04095 [Deltaproteobacteria bacterium]
MKMNLSKVRKGIISSIFIFFLISSSLCAHTLWINLTSHNPKYYKKFGAFSRAYFGWGHRFPVDGFLKFKNLVKFNLINPDGKKEKLIPNPGGFLATDLSLKSQGVYYVEAVKKPGFYTMYERNGKVLHKSAPMTGLKNVILSLYFQEFSKALITTGKDERKNFLKPLGHKIEIIPLENPSKLKKDDIFKIKVFYKGKPARYLNVSGTYFGFSNEDDFAFATKTNKDGIAEIRLLERGNWLLKVNKKIAPDKKYKGKCLNESYTATFTFEVK